MRTLITKIQSALLLSFGALLFSNQSNAAVYTASLSGDFNSSATWGGLAPGSVLSSDVIIIPLGITVNLTNNVYFSGTSSLTVLGMLQTTSSGAGLIMTSGTLSGAGMMKLDTLALGLTSGISYTGNILVKKMTSTGANISSNANIVVSNSLNLSSGILTLASGSLNMGMNSSIWITGGSVVSSGSGLLNFDSTYNVTYLTASTSTGLELNGAGLDSVTVDVSSANTVSLSSNVDVKGMLYLKTGMLSLNGYSLSFVSSGNLSTMGTGSITGSSMSNIIVNTSSSLSGAIKFTSGSNLLNNFTMNTGSSASSAGLGSDLTINGTLMLQSGKLRLGNNNLKLNTGAMISGGTANSYIVTDGNGKVTMNLASSSTDTFEVGTLSNYTPIAVMASSSSVSSDVSVNVSGSVLANGTTGTDLSATQPMVKNTWFVSSTASSGIDFSLMAMWDASMEVNSFNRTQAYVSHYTGGVWDVSTPVSASSSLGMYSITRAGITSLSPFMVSDKDAKTTSLAEVNKNKNEVKLYPNPVGNTIYLQSASAINAFTIYDVMGKAVRTGMANKNSVSVDDLSSGTYYIQVSNKEGTSATQRFVKL